MKESNNSIGFSYGLYRFLRIFILTLVYGFYYSFFFFTGLSFCIGSIAHFLNITKYPFSDNWTAIIACGLGIIMIRIGRKDIDNGSGKISEI